MSCCYPTCLADLVPWLDKAGTGAWVEAVVNVGGNDSDCDDEDDDDASGGEAADVLCLDVVWTASKPERCSLVASSVVELLLLCWPTPLSPSPFSGPPLPCL